MTPEDLYRFLAQHEIPYQRLEHPPVYTCEEAARELPDAPGAHTKNLLLVNEDKSRYFLLSVSEEKRTHFKKLAKSLGVKKLRFASEEDLKELLGVDLGAVTLLGVINDRDNRVEVLIDQDLWQEDSFQCHPLVNTATLVIQKSDLEKLLNLLNHPPVIIELPIVE